MNDPDNTFGPYLMNGTEIFAMDENGAYNAVSFPGGINWFAMNDQTQMLGWNTSTGAWDTLINDQAYSVQSLLPTGWQIDPVNGSGGGSLNAINSNGVILATLLKTTDQLQHVVLLLPLSLTNVSDPTVRNGANGNDTPIQFKTSPTDTNIKAVAWIAGNDPNHGNAPQMPKLKAACVQLSGVQLCWKLQVIFHDRNTNPHRDFDTGDPYNTNTSPDAVPQDTVTIPSVNGSSDMNAQNGWVQISDGSPWDLTKDNDWNAAVAAGFFGGDATLSLQILSGDGATTVMPEQDFLFRIAGENPNPQLCQNFITGLYGGPNPPARDPHAPNAWKGFWFLDAIAKEETGGEGEVQNALGLVGNTHFYHQFLYDGGRNAPAPGREGMPDWHDDRTNQARPTGTGGYGLFQLTYAQPDGPSNYIMPRAWIWNWQANAQAILQEFQGKLTDGQNLYAGLTATYPASGSIPNYKHFSGLEAIVITYYNGMDGSTQKPLIHVNGYSTRQGSCWFPLSRGWQFRQNSNSYCDKVDSFVGNGPH